jgi:hypothetical protein
MIPDFHIPSRHVCELATYEHFLCTRVYIYIHCKFISLTSKKMIARIKEKNKFILYWIVPVLNRPFCVNILQ